MAIPHLPLAYLALFLPVLVSAQTLQTVTLAKSQIATAQRFEGVVEAVQQATVSAQTGGRIEEILFDVDDYVESGQVILRFRAREQEARYRSAKAGLEETRAQLDQAQSEFDRIKVIFAKRLVAKAQLDQAEAAFSTASARHKAAESRLREAEEQREHTIVRAPYSGVVVERHVEQGEMARVGTPLLTGLSLDQLRVSANIPQQLIGQLRREKQVAIEVDGQARIQPVKLVIVPRIDPRSHTFLIRADLPEGLKGLFPGMLVKVVIDTASRAGILVPEGAIVRRGEVTGLYVVNQDNHISLRQVRLGRVSDVEQIEVLAGLREGEVVMLDPDQAVVMLKAQGQK